MTDLEITKLCAEAMGVKMLPLWTVCTSRDVRCENKCKGKNCEPMSGECALAEIDRDPWLPEGKIIEEHFDPLHDDAQAMALLKRFRLYPRPQADGGWWIEGQSDGSKETLNRAICECVAKMQKGKE